eukprot:2942282-Rhodomonas_salina.1
MRPLTRTGVRGGCGHVGGRLHRLRNGHAAVSVGEKRHLPPAPLPLVPPGRTQIAYQGYSWRWSRRLTLRTA